MDIIETLNPLMFTEYLKKYGNTICGRHPIGVLLQVIIKQEHEIDKVLRTMEEILKIGILRFQLIRNRVF